ncbi:class I SAM-dependent methyltransferase [Streptomyces pluripotens]|uniref:Class I SAM-dependent methyltransferase n=1 Tax=Streptomyces pluripotens TaxID=1355015 RepID=A0A221P5M2_9ACTN|nr:MULTISPECIES: class I SAM-dependent methyltransferase [Streptomyces]ARP73164.1 SAM-dependent methyltransferase [Streptomyces pluripotens]ASN27414.1 class I SAM-dependent methyltransferase [Streptomyces pluripotens]KIE28617.1 methyltransferase [Streptomyces sp. MUSC 125]MCH0558061.1 class I SAM-dependent methyltransferase [Streptomyces sp. MUM 16J]
MNVSNNYRHSWESYWSETSGTKGEAIWDSDPSLTAGPHSELLLPYADPNRTIVDLGCGNGTQTRYLSGRFARAVGVDLSHAAVEHARRAAHGDAVEFQQLDLTDTDAVRTLHDRLGDSNVYMRAVIHQSEPAARPAVAAAVAELIGTEGRAFVVELTSGSRDVLQRAAAGPAGPPPKLQRVFRHGLRPADADDQEIPRLLAESGLTILADGETTLAQTEYLADGTRIELPARWFILAGK